MQRGPSDEQIRSMCEAAAREAMTELERRFADARAAAHPWCIRLHAIGDWSVDQADVVLPVRWPSVTVVVTPGTPVNHIADALERAWIDDRSEMARYPTSP